MQLSFPFFIVLSLVVVGSTVWIVAAEPCAPGTDDTNHNYGAYDLDACTACAASGNGHTGHSVCCNALYRHSDGRDDDTFFDDNKLFTHCHIEHSACTGVGQGDCYPGLTCVGTCQLNTEDPNAHAPSVPLSIPIFQTITGSFSMGTSTIQGGPVFVVVVVGLLGAALMTLYRSRHRGLFLHRHHYHEVEATATATLRMAV